MSESEPTAVGAYRCANLQCGNKGTLLCSRCKKARYCSKDCQRADWKQRHKQSCGQDEGMAQASGRDMLAALTSGSSGGWYTGIKRKRVYERIWMSFQMRVEDEYVHAGNLVGTYGQQGGGGSKTETSREFRKYVDKLSEKNLLPPDWTDQDLQKLLKGAEENIHFAIEKSDVVERFGYSSGEHFVLRVLAETALGPIGNWV